MTEQTTSTRETTTSPVNVASSEELRSFARGTGFVLQAVGASLFFLSTCACCGFAFVEGGGVWTGQSETGETITATNITGDPQAYTLLLLTSALGSLALVGFGVGQQADRGRFPAIGSAFTTGTMFGMYLLAVLRMVRADEPIQWIVITSVLALLSLLLCGLSFPALVQTLKNPTPSAPPTVAAEAFPDSWAQERPKDKSPAKQDLLRRRDRIDRELREMEQAERDSENTD